MKKIRIGVVGAGRGVDLARNFLLLGCDVVALCDNRKGRLEYGKERLKGCEAYYSDFDEFLNHDMDAVVLANFFHEHTPLAIKCFEKGLHVFSECISNGTMAEGVELVRAFEKTSGVVYMLAENYPQMKFNREMKRICDSGTLGRIMFAEGEYNHPGDPRNGEFRKTYNYYPEHWRNYLPATYYITHSLGPVMWATGATPKRVSAFPIFMPPAPGNYPVSKQVGDKTAIVITQNDDDSVFRVTGCAAFGGHHNAYRICGTNGQIENPHGGGTKVTLHYNHWQLPEGAEELSTYEPDWNDKDEELIKTSGHGGGDYLTARMFLDCIKEGRQPEHPFDIYSATVMSSVAILGHRSVMNGGVPYDIPDLRKEEDRAKFENDRLTPFIGGDGSKPDYPCCSRPDYKADPEQFDLYLKDLERLFGEDK